MSSLLSVCVSVKLTSRRSYSHRSSQCAGTDSTAERGSRPRLRRLLLGESITLAGRCSAVDFVLGYRCEWLTRAGSSSSFLNAALQVALRAKSIEGKRNGIEALAAILSTQSALDPLGELSDSGLVDAGLNLATPGRDLFASALDTILAGFGDYTVDQRGDVGSWVRLVSIAAVECTFAALARGSSRLAQLSLFDQDQLDVAVSSLLKQAVERLDKLREAAGQALERMFGLEAARSMAEQPMLRAPALFAGLQYAISPRSLCLS